MNTFELTLDLSKQVSMEPLRLRQGDKLGTTVRATIYDHGEPLTGSYTARFSMRRPSGETYYRESATFSNGVATVTIDESKAAAVYGNTFGYFEILQGSTVIASTGDFPVVILRSATDGAVEGEVYDSAIQEALDKLDRATGEVAVLVQDATVEYLDAHPELIVNIPDNSVTDPKLIQKGGVLDRVGRLMYRLDNLLTNALPEGETATATDAAQTPMAGLALYGRSTQDGTPTPSAPVPIVSVAPDSQGNISLWARGRNLVGDLAAIKARGTHGTWNGNTYTDNGVSFAFNEDGSIVANGTSTGLSIIQLAQTDFLLQAGTYQLSGCPAGGGTTTYRLDVERVGASVFATDNGSGATFTLDTETNINVRLRVPSGAALANKVFRPMLRLASTGAEFVPYTATVTPIPLDGHELRSLPDGTRDELAVDENGHAVLVQRVGSVDLGTLAWAPISSSDTSKMRMDSRGVRSSISPTPGGVVPNVMCERYQPKKNSDVYLLNTGVNIASDGDIVIYDPDYNTNDSASAFAAAVSGVALIYPLATPVTHDLGTIDPVPLVGPDLTAQAVPSAPFALTYERDLNTTLARLESAIATLA